MNYKCPNYECEKGRVPDRKSVNGSTFCPVCHGKGYIPQSLPVPNEEKVFSSDLDFTSPNKRWRPCSGVGVIQGIPSFNGKAIATDGILVIIERPNGEKVVGHLENFKRAKQAKQRGERQPKIDVNANLFE